MTRQAAHSLPELLVALTVMGATLTAVGSASVLGARWTLDAVIRQEALGAAEAVLDSLVSLPVEPVPGRAGLSSLPVAIEWATSAIMAADGAAGAAVAVHVVRDGVVARDTVARVVGIWIPQAMLLEP